MSEWRFIRFEGAICHTVPVELEAGIVDDLVRRDCDLHSVQPVTGSSIDIPGPVCVDRPWETFDVDGLSLDIPCEDVEALADYLGGLQVRHTRDNEPYYKMHGFMRCLVLTPIQRDDLHMQMVERIPGADARSSEFYRTRKTPAQALRYANERAGGPLPAGIIPDRHAHFQDDDEELN